MSGRGEVFKPAKDKRKKAPVRHVTVSAETKRAYEEAAKARSDREQSYGQHLPEDGRGRR